MTAPDLVPVGTAAWIRAHAWTPRMRKTHKEIPAFYTTCACQHGPSFNCTVGHHHKCGRGTPLRSYETLICSRGGDHPAVFREPYAHKTDTSATGPRYESLALVWLADRVCHWVCPCPCGHKQSSNAPSKSLQESLW